MYSFTGFIRDHFAPNNEHGTATGMPTYVKTFDELRLSLDNGPVYSYYSTEQNDFKAYFGSGSGHFIGVTGAVYAQGHPDLVTTNNPWNDRNIQTYSNFEKGIPGDSLGMSFREIYQVNP